MALKASLLGAFPLTSAVVLSILAFFIDSGKGKKLDALVATLPLTLLALYRVVFHPLSKFPGPIWNKITTLPIAYKAIVGTRYRHLRDLHDKYGPVVRIGPNELSFVTPSAVNRIYGSSQSLDRAHVYDLHPLATVSDGVFFLQDRTKHGARRRVWNRTISSMALREYRPAAVSSVDKFIARILKDQETQGSADASQVCIEWAFDAMNMIWFGGRAFVGSKPFLESGDLTIPNQGSRELILFDTLAYLPLLFYLAKDLPGAEKHRQFEKLAKYTARRIVKESFEPHEGVSHLLNKENPLNPRDLPFEIETILLGGSDSVGAMSTFLVYFVVAETAWRNRVREELDNAFQGTRDASQNIDVLETLPVFNAFIQESMRIGQSFSGLPRAIPSEGAVIDDRYIPPGTTVSVPIHAYHMDYTAFGEDARIFNPGRFLDPENLAKKNPYFVFSAGRHKCVGTKLSYLELRIFLAQVLLKLDVEKPKDWNDKLWWDGIRNWRSTEFKYPLRVNFYPRRD